jgi:hypothetical protein
MLPGSTKHLDLFLLHSRQRGTVSIILDLSYTDVLAVIGGAVDGCTLQLHAGTLACSGLVGGDGRAVKIAVEVFRNANSPCRRDRPISVLQPCAHRAPVRCCTGMMSFFGDFGWSVIGNGDRCLLVQAEGSTGNLFVFQLQMLAVTERTERLFGCRHVCGEAMARPAPSGNEAKSISNLHCSGFHRCCGRVPATGI